VIGGAEAFVKPFGVVGWTRIPAADANGGYRFSVPAGLIPQQGFTYWLRFRTEAGRTIDYPPGGERSPIRVVTTAGLPERRIPEAFSWEETAPAEGTALEMPYGGGDGEAGFREGTGDLAPSGPSSFAIAPDGSLFVVDWVNVRIQVFSADGSFVRSLPAPSAEPMDIAIGPDGTLALTTLGVNATAFEVSPDGVVLGRYPVAFGLPARVQASIDGPHVMVGQGEWARVRSIRGVPLPAAGQTIAQTVAVPLADGGIGFSTELGRGRFAAVWTRPDRSRAGAIVRLPIGVRPGVDYFVQPMDDGGAILAKGLWDDTHSVVGLFRFDAAGRISSFVTLPEPSVEQDAFYSKVRFLPPTSVLVVYDEAQGIRYDRFEVSA
jgi:hypothetical protein